MPSVIPQKTNVLGQRNAKHLLSRFSFNTSRARIEAFSMKTPQEALVELFDYSYDPEWLTSVHPYDIMPTTNNNVVRKKIIAWWLEKAMKDSTCHHKLHLFLFTCFTTDIFLINPDKFYEYFKLLSLYTRGSFKTLAFHMTKDNNMLAYLDGQSNVKTNPNENYAREFFELFTIGKGQTDGVGSYTNYTEHDISEAAKLLTGWKQGGHLVYENGDESIYGGYNLASVHDTTDKTFSSKFGNQTIAGNSDAEVELQQFVTMVFNQIATAKNICRKIYYFFVADTISDEVEDSIITPLAQLLYDNDYHIEVVLKELFASQHFYDEEDENPFDQKIGALIKSPLDLTLGIMSYFGADAQSNKSFNFYTYHLNDLYLASSSMWLFSPPNVAGFPAYYQEPLRSKNWFDSNTYLPRYKFAELLLTNKKAFGSGANGTGLISFNVLGFIDNTSNVPIPNYASNVVTTLLDDLFPDGYTTERFDYYLNTIFLDGLNPVDWTLTWDAYKNGDNSAFTQSTATNEIKIRVSNLIQAILQSPEFQIL